MAPPNLTREQAAERAAILSVDNYRIELDLTKPVKITPEPQTNSLIVSSTYENVIALEEIIGMFDRLPITDAVPES